MTNIGLIVTVNKYKNHFASQTSTLVCSTMEEAHLELIKYLVAHFSLLTIDFPLDYEEFEFIWFNEIHVGTNVFVYRVFNDNTWSEPWTHQELYDEVMEAMHINELYNIPEFDKMYGEPKYENNIEDEQSSDEEQSIDTFTTTNQAMLEVEDQMKKIMRDTIENSHNFDTCNCTQCIEMKQFIKNETE